jgi:aminocarboxymuconate-semialdehyde decarboxylase
VSDAGAALKIDLHTHILPERWPDLHERFGTDGWVTIDHCGPCRARMMLDGRVFREIDDRCWDPARRVRDCDERRVDVQVLSTVPVMFAYGQPAAEALHLARILNDHLADVCRAHPARFAGLGTIPLQDPALAVRELERCVRALDLAGVEIGTHVNDWNLDAPELFDVFAAAELLGAAVFVHPWDMMARERMPKYWLPWLVGMPAETSLAICSMIFGGVFARLPRLRVAFAHGGGAFPGTFGRIEHGFRVRPDLVAVDNPIPPREHLGRFYLDSLVHDAAALRFLIDLVGAERVALGSDYPFPLGEIAPGALIESMEDLTAAQRRRLLGETALEFLGVEAGRFAAPSRRTLSAGGAPGRRVRGGRA